MRYELLNMTAPLPIRSKMSKMLTDVKSSDITIVFLLYFFTPKNYAEHYKNKNTLVSTAVSFLQFLVI